MTGLGRCGRADRHAPLRKETSMLLRRPPQRDAMAAPTKRRRRRWPACLLCATGRDRGRTKPYLPYHDYRPDCYDEIFSRKVGEIEESFGSILRSHACCEITSQASPPTHFRLRCRFAITADDRGRLRYALYDEGQPKVTVSELPIASRQINDLMPKLLAEVEKRQGILRDNLTSVHFLATLAERDVVVTLIYGAPIDEAEWTRRAGDLSSALGPGISLIGRSKGVKAVFGNDYVIESMDVEGFPETLSWKQVEGAFSNPNGYICKRTIEHICGICRDIERDVGGRKDLLDLYCGNGNYTVPLSGHFSKILSVELNKSLTEVAVENFRMNGVTNVRMVRSCCMRFSEAVVTGKGSGSVLEYYESCDFSAILVDPPRAGLDPNTLALAARFDHVIYISCQQETLRTCLGDLVKTHDVRSFRVFDHFPYTKYVECVVHLRRRKTPLATP